MKGFFILLIGISGFGFLQAQKQFEIRYLGNMGIAITHNDSTILIDGLHDFYGDDYLPTDPSAINAILNKQEPYKKIIVIAVTHRHSDHFDSAIMANVANVHPAALLIGGKQTRSFTTAAVQKKFLPIADSITIKVNTGLLINLRLVPHTYPARHSAVENYRVEVVWNGFRIVHLGDADEKDEAIASLKVKPDVMVVPAWFFSNDGIKLLEKIKPVKILATHISPADNTIYKSEKLNGEIINFRKYGDLIKI